MDILLTNYETVNKTFQFNYSYYDFVNVRVLEYLHEILYLHLEPVHLHSQLTNQNFEEPICDNKTDASFSLNVQI